MNRRRKRTRTSAVADMPPDSCTNVFARGRHSALRITYSQHLTPLMMEIPLSYRVHIEFGYGKTRMAGLQPGEGRVMIDSVIWAQYINVTDTQTATSP